MLKHRVHSKATEVHAGRSRTARETVLWCLAAGTQYGNHGHEARQSAKVNTPPPATMVQILPFGFRTDSFKEAPESKQDTSICLQCGTSVAQV